MIFTKKKFRVYRGRGFLLAEAIFGAFLVAAMIGGLAAVMQSWERSLLSAKGRTGARMIVRQEMERCLNYAYADLESCATLGIPRVMTISRTLGAQKVNSSYEIHITVTPVLDSDLKRLEVRAHFGSDKTTKAVLNTVVFDGPR